MAPKMSSAESLILSSCRYKPSRQEAAARASDADNDQPMLTPDRDIR